MAKMLGKIRPSWCPVCHSEPGPDCPDSGRTVRQVRQAEARQVAWEIRDQVAETRT